MATLDEKQFELEGVVFGLFAPVAITADGWTPGSPSLRTQDVDNVTGDGIRMGRDLKGSATWSFSMYADRDTENGAWDSLAELAAVWDNDEIRQESGRVVPLRYRVAGQDRRVYGRPRRWTISPGNASLSGRIDVEADFATVDHRSYDDVGESKLIALAAPVDPDAGLIPPFTVPFITTATSTSRQASIVIGGTAPTPINLTFTGPISNATATVGDWTAQLRDPVLSGADNAVTIDSRPWVRTVTDASGGGVRVSPRVTRMSKMILPPGVHQVVFSGEDPSGTSTLLVSWHNAHRTPR